MLESNYISGVDETAEEGSSFSSFVIAFILILLAAAA
jgi:hypothetical protein